MHNRTTTSIDEKLPVFLCVGVRWGVGVRWEKDGTTHVMMNRGWGVMFFEYDPVRLRSVPSPEHTQSPIIIKTNSYVVDIDPEITQMGVKKAFS